jgi:hypothetical protein
VRSAALIDKLQSSGGQGAANGLNDSYTGTPKHNSDMSHVFAVPYH